jgi:hypothetical protein
MTVCKIALPIAAVMTAPYDAPESESIALVAVLFKTYRGQGSHLSVTVIPGLKVPKFVVIAT